MRPQEAEDGIGILQQESVKLIDGSSGFCCWFGGSWGIFIGAKCES